MLTEDARVITSVPSPTASPSPSTGQLSAGSKLRGASKWGRLLGSSSVDSASDSSAKVAVSRSLSARESLRESSQARSSISPSNNGGGQGNKVLNGSHIHSFLYYFMACKFKVFPKSVKLSPGPASLTRQDTIEEGGEGETSSQNRETAHRASIQLDHRPQLAVDRPPKTERDPLLDTLDKERAKERQREERNLSLERERQIEMAKARETTSDNYDTGLREQPSTLAQRDLISTVLDMKVDVRLEMQRMSQRISRIEDLLTDLVNRLVVDSSEQSSPGDNNPSQASATSPTGPTTINVPSSSGSLTPSGPNTGGGNGLGPILLRKRRSKNRKPPAPAPPPKQYSESEDSRLIESDIPSTSSRKREFL